MGLALTVLNILLYIGILILVVAIVLWALRYWGVEIDPLIRKALVFIVIILVLIVIISFFSGVSFLPPIVGGGGGGAVVVPVR
jgi:hypothetical protein